MQIRPLVHSDAGEYRALMLEGYDLEEENFTSTVLERAAEPLSWWQNRISNPRNSSQVFGALHEGRLVGIVTIEYSTRLKTRHSAHLVGMYVSQLQRQSGAGRALLQAVIEHASTRTEMKVITLTVTQGNTNAIHLYESVGFKLWGIEPMAVSIGIEYKAKVHMQLRLPVHP